MRIRRVRYASARGETLAYRGTMAAALRAPGGWRALAGLWRALRRAAREEMAAGADLIHAHWWVPAGLAAPPERPARADGARHRRGDASHLPARAPARAPGVRARAGRHRRLPRAGGLGAERHRPPHRGGARAPHAGRHRDLALDHRRGRHDRRLPPHGAEADQPGDRDHRVPRLVRPRPPAHGRRRWSGARGARAPGRAPRDRALRPLRRRRRPERGDRVPRPRRRDALSGRRARASAWPPPRR